MNPKIDIGVITDYLSGLQDQICNAVGRVENTAFEEDEWQRPEGGGGRTRVLRNGETFEQAGINYSFVTGEQLPASATALRPDLAGAGFQAAGVSIVMHPHNPYAPTSHFNVRFFHAESPNGNSDWWFGGGFDLTPYYGFKEDARTWHQKAQEACETLGPGSYEKFKHWCDEYFYLKHRQEPRGIGGIFFDDLNEPDFDHCFSFLQAVGTAYPEAYIPIIEKRKDLAFGERERQFQLYRRGRYVEFNLVYDRGTLFGLQSGGRTESILMSLPPQVRWEYNWQPEPDSAEAELYRDFLVAKDWINEK